MSSVDLGGMVGDRVLRHLKTTTTGLSDSVTTMRLFQIIRAEQTIIARLST